MKRTLIRLNGRLVRVTPQQLQRIRIESASNSGIPVIDLIWGTEGERILNTTQLNTSGVLDYLSIREPARRIRK